MSVSVGGTASWERKAGCSSALDMSMGGVGACGMSAAADGAETMPVEEAMGEAGFMLPAVQNPAQFCRANFKLGKGEDYDQAMQFAKGTTCPFSCTNGQSRALSSAPHVLRCMCANSVPHDMSTVSVASSTKAGCASGVFSVTTRAPAARRSTAWRENCSITSLVKMVLAM